MAYTGRKHKVIKALNRAAVTPLMFVAGLGAAFSLVVLLAVFTFLGHLIVGLLVCGMVVVVAVALLLIGIRDRWRLLFIVTSPFISKRYDAGKY